MIPNYKKNLVEFTMGADPEMAMTDKKGQTIPASENVKDRAGKFGADGHANTFEIRPSPEVCPLKLQQNIRGIFVQEIKDNPKLLKHKWLSGSFQAGQNLGGHVHFGIKSSLVKPVEAAGILSQYMGAIGLLLEDKEGAKKRRSGSYGHMEDNRPQDWGFEYRTLSSWLTHPAVTAGILCGCKIVMDEFVNNKNFKCGYYVQNDVFKTADTEHVRKKYDLIWDDITNMRLYPKYKRYVDVLDNLIRRNRTWFPKTDMRAPWGLIDPTVIGGEETTLDSIWAPYVTNVETRRRPVPRVSVVSEEW